MSERDNQGRHWRVNGNRFELFSRNPRTQKDSIESTIDAVPAKDTWCKCGGKVLQAAGAPRSLDRWQMCSKCSATIKQRYRGE